MSEALVRPGTTPQASVDQTSPVPANASFRKELTKIMPGYEWTVHRSFTPDHLNATGIQSSGFNRLSTLSVTRRDREGRVEYVAKSAGFGKRAPWLHASTDATLARALRGLQQHYEAMANTYRGHAASLQSGRKAAPPTGASGDQDAAASLARDENQ